MTTSFARIWRAPNRSQLSTISFSLLAAILLTQCQSAEQNTDTQPSLTKTQVVSEPEIANHATPKSLFRLQVVKTDQQLTLDGNLADPHTQDSLLTQLQQHYGKLHIQNHLQLQAGASSPFSNDTLQALISATQGIKHLSLALTERHVSVSGEVATQAAKAQLKQQFQALLTTPLTFNIQAPPSNAERLAAQAVAQKAAHLAQLKLIEQQHLTKQHAQAVEIERLTKALAHTQEQTQQSILQNTQKLKLAAQQHLEATLTKTHNNHQQQLSATLAALNTKHQQQLLATIESTRLEERAAFALKEKRLQKESETKLTQALKKAQQQAQKKQAEITTAQQLAEKARETAAKARQKAIEQQHAQQKKADQVAKQQQRAKQHQQQLAQCQAQITHRLEQVPALFQRNQLRIIGSHYQRLNELAQYINHCQRQYFQQRYYIEVIAQAGQGETPPHSLAFSEARAKTLVAYLENMSGVSRGLLRPTQDTYPNMIGPAQLRMRIKAKP